MEIKEVVLAATGVALAQFPKDALPELAIVGKSNVGKSSLINMLLGRRKLARISSTPGKTRTINFYEINNQFYFVDLPGYGYAKVAKSQQQQWGQMIENYLYQRDCLTGILFLVDIRHAPGKNDLLMYQWLKHYGFPVILVATKSDKLKRSQIQKQLHDIRTSLDLSQQDLIIPCSSTNKVGRDDLLLALESLLSHV